MNTLQLESILRPILGPSFAGVFPCDLLPYKIDKRPCYLVANTHDQTREGEHWVGMIIESEPEKSSFFDSYGHDPDFVYYPRSFVDFLARNSIEVTFSKRQVQDFFSTSCGPHVIFYLCQRFKGLSFQEVMRLYSDNLKSNDALVNKFVKKCAKCISYVKSGNMCNQKSCSLKLFHDCHI